MKSTITKLGAERLTKLINFMEELPDESFDFSLFVSERNPITDFGTVCCAAGWLPKIDPENWKWDGVSIIFHSRNETWATDKDLSQYFECDRDVANLLFLPYHSKGSINRVQDVNTETFIFLGENPARAEWVEHARKVLDNLIIEG